MIASSPPRASEYVTSTTTVGRVPLASKPIFARTDAGDSRAPSSATAIGAIAYAVNVSRSASAACDFGWLATRATMRSVGSPVPAV